MSDGYAVANALAILKRVSFEGPASTVMSSGLRRRMIH
jgi:hypothetical protein